MNPYSIRLNSDFLDYYDHWFDNSTSPLVFDRISTGGMSRSEMFDLFTSINLLTPRYGKVRDLGLAEYDLAVVYLDEKSHRGEGKIQISYTRARALYPDHFASEYMYPSCISYRYLKIGSREFWLSYFSSNDWRSNYGDVLIYILKKDIWEDLSFPKVEGLDNYPLFAIDFVRDNMYKYYAIDFNVAPQVKGTGIEDGYLSPLDAANEIKNHILSKGT